MQADEHAAKAATTQADARARLVDMLADVASPRNRAGDECQCSRRLCRCSVHLYFLFASGGTSMIQGHGSLAFTLLPFLTIWIFMIISCK